MVIMIMMIIMMMVIIAVTQPILKFLARTSRFCMKVDLDNTYNIVTSGKR